MAELCHVCLGGPGRMKAPGYGFHVCDDCWRAAENGWQRTHEPVLFQALARGGLLIPDRNEHGLLPRAYLPPAEHDL